MKGLFIVLLVIVIILCVLVAPSGDNYLRIHIRADSDMDCDQTVKYLVRDAVVDFLTPIVCQCDSPESARLAVRAKLGEIECVANAVLKRYGYDYTAKASLRKESFPTRSYGKIVLVSGVYNALVLNLGSGKGQNWWCVVYPPLCFLGGETNGAQAITYRSKILEIIQKYSNAEQ